MSQHGCSPWNVCVTEIDYTNESVWHARILYKLKQINLNCNMYQYIQNLSCEKQGKPYSSDMGHESVIALLQILI